MRAYRTIPELTPQKIELFWSRVQKTDSCWLWTGRVTKGYGRFMAGNGREFAVHRLAYTLLIGPVPVDRQIDHVKARGCTSKLCVNPAHLEVVDCRENNRRSESPTARNARKTHCKNGHEFTPENTYSVPTGGRACRTCMLENKRAWKLARPKVVDTKSIAAINRAKTHCKHGHEFTPENTMHQKTGRQCKTCHYLRTPKGRLYGLAFRNSGHRVDRDGTPTSE